MVKACTSSPSATAPHICVMPVPTAATKTLGVPKSEGSGVNIGVIRVWV